MLEPFVSEVSCPSAALLEGATAGVVLHRRGSPGEVVGLGGDDLLTGGSPLLPVARSSLEEGRLSSLFLWPRGGRHAPEGHVRVTVLRGRQEGASEVLGVVLLAPAGECRGLTPRELEVLGLLVEGCSNAQIAEFLVLAPRTVAAHLEHVLRKLGAPTRTLAAVRADREGLYVPAAARRETRGDGGEHPGLPAGPGRCAETLRSPLGAWSARTPGALVEDASATSSRGAAVLGAGAAAPSR